MYTAIWSKRRTNRVCVKVSLLYFSSWTFLTSSTLSLESEINSLRLRLIFPFIYITFKLENWPPSLWAHRWDSPVYYFARGLPRCNTVNELGALNNRNLLSPSSGGWDWEFKLRREAFLCSPLLLMVCCAPSVFSWFINAFFCISFQVTRRFPYVVFIFTKFLASVKDFSYIGPGAHPLLCMTSS